jgi:hypothetical protein
MRDHSFSVDEFYATNTTTARWLFDVVADRYDTSGKTALEPCVGGYAFPDVASAVEWTTCDLNTWTDRDPDHLGDFLELDLPTFDFVITNPPFGRGNKLAFAFAGKACKHAPVVAMVLPSIMSVWSKRLDNVIPRDMKMVFAEPCPNQWFDLPDGSTRDVRCHGVIFERVEGYKRPKFVPPVEDKRKDLIDFNDNGKWCIRVFGDGIGDIREWTPELKSGCFVRFDTHGKQCAGLKLLASYPWRFIYGNAGQRRAPWGKLAKKTPTITANQILQHVNCMAVLEGRMSPMEGVDYEGFLKRFTEQTFFGLTLPTV